VPARLDVFDVSGRLVRKLGNGTFAAGSHVLEWDGRDGAGAPSAAGVYFVRLASGDRSVISRIVRLR
jgi:flagellar hook assembly protein FlgD